MNNIKDPMGDRMKTYEAIEASRRFMPLLPVVVRLDGRSFSTFTRRAKRPFDEALHGLMVATTRALVEESVACVGFTASDEISLLYYSPDLRSQIFFDGRIQKMVSVLAAYEPILGGRQVEVLEVYEDREVRSVSFSMKSPAVNRYIAGKIGRNRGVRFSRENVYTRDKGLC